MGLFLLELLGLGMWGKDGIFFDSFLIRFGILIYFN